MEVQVTALSRRGTALMRRSWRVSAPRVRFGRGTGSEIPLSDSRVDFTAAAMFPLGNGLMVEAVGPTPMRLNGVSTRAAPVKPGDQLDIGPYQITLEEPPPGCEASLTVELVQPLGNSLDQLLSRSRIGLEQTSISKRRAAWLGVIAVLAIGFTPLAVLTTGPTQQQPAAPSSARSFPTGLMPLLWMPGEMSNAHRFVAAECGTCHETPFTRVADRACVGCHQQKGPHIDPSLRLGEVQDRLERTPCTECHQEHRGARGLIVRDAQLCLDCHQSLTEKAPGAGVPDIGGFPGGHAQFRLTVSASGAPDKVERIAIGSPSPPIGRSGIKFSHAAHLVPSGFPALDIAPLTCGVCHVAEPSGQGFQPITYKQQCASCHALDFEPRESPWLSGRVPHGDDIGIVAAVWNFYAGKALLNATRESPAAAVTRRVAGAHAENSEGSSPANAQQWVAKKTELTLRTIVLDQKRGCAYCHFGTGPNGSIEVPDLTSLASGRTGSEPSRMIAPVLLRTRFLPHARFDHAKHTAVGCDQCHPARNADTSERLLIPGIENCAECHGSERAALRAQSTCITCHRFHSNADGPIRDSSPESRK